jgi:hypothetical protein
VIYFILDRERQAVKIGISMNPRKRLVELQQANPGTLELLATVPGDATREWLIHEQFKSSRLRGEWFRATKKLMSRIEYHRGQQGYKREEQKCTEREACKRREKRAREIQAKIDAEIETGWKRILQHGERASSDDAAGGAAESRRRHRNKVPRQASKT